MTEQHHLSVTQVQGTLQLVDEAERHYSLELGLEVVREFRIELHCDDDCVDESVAAILSTGRTGQHVAGWVYVSDLTSSSDSIGHMPWRCYLHALRPAKTHDFFDGRYPSTKHAQLCQGFR